MGAPYTNYEVGKIYFFEKTPSCWEVNASFSPLLASSYSYFGTSVDMYNIWAVAGQPLTQHGNYINEGTAYVYKLHNDVWTFYDMIFMPEYQDDAKFGTSVSIWKDYMVIGAPGADYNGNDVGSAFIFKKENDNWNILENQVLYPPNSTENCSFGRSISIYNNHIAVGAPNKDISYDGTVKTDAGAVYMYYLENDQIEYIQQITSCYPGDNDHFGNSVSIYGDYLMVGEVIDDVGNYVDAGTVSLYKLDHNTSLWNMWSGFTSDNIQSDGRFGSSVCKSDFNMIIGAEGEGNYRKGAAYILTDFGNPCQTNIDKCTEELLSINYGEIIAETITLGGEECNFTIPPGASIGYLANEIILGAGFTAKNGCNFTASAFDDCSFYYSMPSNQFVCAEIDEIEENEQEKTKVKEIVENNIKVYPNPVTGKLNIKSSISPINHIIIHDLFGRIIIEKQNLNTTYQEIDFSKFAPGMFYINIKAENNQLSGKIIHK